MVDIKIYQLFYIGRIRGSTLKHIKCQFGPRLPEYMGVCFDLSKTLNRNEQCNEDKQFLHITKILFFNCYFTIPPRSRNGVIVV